MAKYPKLEPHAKLKTYGDDGPSVKQLHFYGIAFLLTSIKVKQ